MQESDRKMIEAQAKKINELTDRITKINEEMAFNKQVIMAMSYDSSFFHQLQEACKTHPTLVEEWKSFLMCLQLIVPESSHWKAEPKSYSELIHFYKSRIKS